MYSLVSDLLARLTVSPRHISGDNSEIADVPQELTAEVDSHGSPVSKAPSEWFVCFVPGLQKQWWHKFTHPKHKHVFALKMVGDDEWVIFEPWWNRIMVTTLRIDEAVKFLRWGATGDILKVRERIPGNGSQARGWANCAVQISLMLGRPYWTWTPHGLYRRLSAEDNVEPVDMAKTFEQKVAVATERIVDKGLGDISSLVRLSPEEALMELGNRISKIIFLPKYLALYRFAVSEARRFPAAAAAFFVRGPVQLEAAVRALVSHFRIPGRFSSCEAERISRAFLSMLRGNLYMELVLGGNTEPDQKGLASRTKSMVDLILRAIGERDVWTRENRRGEVNLRRADSIGMVRTNSHFGPLLREEDLQVNPRRSSAMRVSSLE